MSCLKDHKGHQTYKIAYDYYLHNTPLEIVDSCKYLGVTIQHDLKWSEHIIVHNITVKTNRTLSFLRRNLKLNNHYLKETAYFLLVRPQLEYACVVWSPWQRTDVQSLEKSTVELQDLSQVSTIAPAVYPT